LAYLSPVTSNKLFATASSTSTGGGPLLARLVLGATAAPSTSSPAGGSDLDLLSTNVTLSLVAASESVSTGSAALTLVRPVSLVLEGSATAVSSATGAVTGRAQVLPPTFSELKLGAGSKLRRRVFPRFERRPGAGNG
jgi:hypothetical protein